MPTNRTMRRSAGADLGDVLVGMTLSSLLPKDMSGIRLSIDLKPAMDDGMLEKVIAGTGTCTVLSNE